MLPQWEHHRLRFHIQKRTYRSAANHTIEWCEKANRGHEEVTMKASGFFLFFSLPQKGVLNTFIANVDVTHDSSPKMIRLYESHRPPVGSRCQIIRTHMPSTNSGFERLELIECAHGQNFHRPVMDRSLWLRELPIGRPAHILSLLREAHLLRLN